MRDGLPFADHPRQLDLERAYRALQLHFTKFSEVYAQEDDAVRRNTKKAQIREQVIQAGNALAYEVTNAFQVVMEPLNISQHWSTTQIERDLMRPDGVILSALSTGKVRRIQAIIPVQVGSMAKSLQEATYNGDPTPLIQRVLGRPLLQEEKIAISAAGHRAKVRIGEGLQEATCLLAATGLLQGAGILRASHRKENYRISFGDALITSESIGVADMVHALVSLDGEDESDWVCTPDPDLFGQGPSIFIQAVGFSEDPEGADLVAAPWMSQFPALFGPVPDSEVEKTNPQESGRKLNRLRASLHGYLFLEGLDFGNRRVLREVHEAIMQNRRSGITDIQSSISERRQDSFDTFSACFYQYPSGPHYAGRPLLPWEDPGKTDVSFPELRRPSDPSDQDGYAARENRELIPWTSNDPMSGI